ncbi:VanZ family protein [Corynebacterium lizhenjunii]|uniref:VanZ family protein n=1 Tax=Corynebacterium lizhenjunii TaxID=2709394 RepID=A0A7T0PD58_9CORY|nr:VanZ family protein [Corynebacterium lizhenjunii]
MVATLGKRFIDIPGVVNAQAHATRSLDLQLFNGWHNPSVWYAPWTNTFGNIALFMPVGAVLLVLGHTGVRRRWGIGGAVAIGVALSLGIEITQYLGALGFSDIDDVLCNGIGAAVGAALMARLTPRGQAKVLRALGFLSAAAVTFLLCGLLAGIFS